MLNAAAAVLVELDEVQANCGHDASADNTCQGLDEYLITSQCT